MMKIRGIYALSILLIVFILCGVGWHLFRPRNLEPVTIHKAVSDDASFVETSEASQDAKARDAGKETLTFEERAERSKEVTLEAARIFRGTESDPVIDGLQKAMETPEYREYLRKQRETFGVNLSLWWDFLESQGLGSGRILQERYFKEYFPGGRDASYYEPDMRRKIAELALKYPFKDAAGLLKDFWQDRANYIWNRQYFNGHVGDYAWAESIQQNAASVLEELSAVEAKPAASANATSEPRSPDAAEENSGAQASPGGEGSQTVSFEQSRLSGDEQEPERIETGFPEGSNRLSVSDVEKALTDADVEKSLTERFSQQRLTRVLTTLRQYGPQEGLRRLKELDPEIVPHVERVLNPREETD